MSSAIIYVDVSEEALANYRKQFDLSAMPKVWLQTYEAMPEFERSRWFLERFKALKSHLYLSR